VCTPVTIGPRNAAADAGGALATVMAAMAAAGTISAATAE
jgi:hypothetical protein